MRRIAPRSSSAHRWRSPRATDPVAPTRPLATHPPRASPRAPTIAETCSRGSWRSARATAWACSPRASSPPASRRRGLPSSHGVRACRSRCRSCRIPGCGPPLLPPLASDLVLVGAFGNDLVTTVMNTCAPLRTSVTLPANSVAISGADVHDALTRLWRANGDERRASGRSTAECCRQARRR